MKFKLQMEGFEGLEKELKSLARKVRKEVMAKALEEGSREMMAEVGARVPKRTGKLVSSLKMKSNQRSRTADQIGFEITGDYYGRFIEFGHLVRGPNDTYLNRKGEWKKRKGSGKELGFVPPNPFIRTAFAAKEQGVIDGVAKKLRDLLSGAFR